MAIWKSSKRTLRLAASLAGTGLVIYLIASGATRPVGSPGRDLVPRVSPDISRVSIPASETRRPGVADPSPKPPGASAPSGSAAQSETILRIPGPAGLETLATFEAKRLWGNAVTLFDVQEYRGPTGEVSSRAYQFFVGSPPSTREEIVESLDGGADPAAWDQTVRGLEVGATLERPPIVAGWTGLSAELRHAHAGPVLLAAAYGTRRYQLVGRHLGAADPILEYTDGRNRYYYSPREGKVGTELRFAPRTAGPRSAKRREKERQIRENWEGRLAWLDHEGNAR